MTEPCHMDSHAWKCREQWQSSLQISEESWKWWQNRERISLKLRSNSLRIEKLKKDTENLDILLLLKSQPLHRAAPFSVPSAWPGIFYTISGSIMQWRRENRTKACVSEQKELYWGILCSDAAKTGKKPASRKQTALFDILTCSDAGKSVEIPASAIVLETLGAH